VHQQLSTHLLGALQHQLQQGGAAGAQDAMRAGSNLSKMATHMQALGLSAVTAEVQEGKQGMLCFDRCAALCCCFWLQLCFVETQSSLAPCTLDTRCTLDML
jgi:hypothetical protein